jgi:hypothetical protein
VVVSLFQHPTKALSEHFFVHFQGLVSTGDIERSRARTSGTTHPGVQNENGIAECEDHGLFLAQLTMLVTNMIQIYFHHIRHSLVLGRLPRFLSVLHVGKHYL